MSRYTINYFMLNFKSCLFVFWGYMVNGGLKANTSWGKKGEGNAFFVLFRLHSEFTWEFYQHSWWYAYSEWIPHRCKFFGLASLSFFFWDTGLKGWICLLCLENDALRLTCHLFQTACPAVENKEQFCRHL